MSWAVPLPGKRTPLAPVIPDHGFEVLCLAEDLRDGTWLGVTRNTKPDWKANVNALVRYDFDFKPIGEPVVLQPRPGTARPDRHVFILDMRFVRWEHGNVVTSGVQFEWAQHMDRIVEYLWDSRTGECLRSTELCSSEIYSKPEKNWLPLPWGGYLYDHGPVRCYRDDVSEAPVMREVPSTIDLTGARGSAAPISYRNGYLYLVHEVKHSRREDLAVRRYQCRFVWIRDRNWNDMQVSPPFCLADGIWEVCFSITARPEGLVMACNHMGTEAFLITLDYETLDILLTPS